MTNDFIKAMNNHEKQKEIEATFTNGTKAIYTINILNLLCTDANVKHIIDNETGELLYYKK